MKQSIEVVMLPTENKSNVHIYANGNLFYTLNKVKATNERNGYQAQHIYITVDQSVEPIKEGDWYENNKVIFKADDVFDKGNNPKLNKSNRKIIATTNIKLTSIVKQLELKGYSKPSELVPQLKQSFLKEFIANPEGKWEVEYETMWKNEGKNGLQPFPDATTTDRRKILKLNQDNTVNITLVVSELKYEKYRDEDGVYFYELTLKSNAKCIVPKELGDYIHKLESTITTVK